MILIKRPRSGRSQRHMQRFFSPFLHNKTLQEGVKDLSLLMIIFVFFGLAEGLVYFLLGENELYLLLSMFLVGAFFSNIIAHFVAKRIPKYV